MKVREPSATSLIFATGKMVVNGTKTVQENQEAARFIANQIKKCYPNTKLTDWRIQNLVASINYGFHINLSKLNDVCETLGIPKGKEGYQYQPGNEDGQFPGFFFKMKKPNASADEPKVKLIIFSSGKVNLTNAKCVQDVSNSYKYFFEEILIKHQLFEGRSEENEKPKKRKYTRKKKQEIDNLRSMSKGSDSLGENDND